MEIGLKDFNRCCRCCLVTVDTLQPLFGGSLDEMLARLMNFEVLQNDGYPQKICLRCILKLSSAHTFYLSVTKSQTILEKILKASKDNGEESNVLYESEKNGESNTWGEEIHTAEKVPYNPPVNALESRSVDTATDNSSDDEEGYKCLQCDHTAEDAELLQAHLRTHLISDTTTGDSSAHRNIYLCNYCGARFRWRTSLAKHVRRHRGRGHQCPHCHKLFAEASTLKVHLVSHSIDNPKPFHCGKCDRAFTQQSSLKKHEELHTTRQKLSCQQCEKTFLHKSSLQRHVESAHVPAECSLCNKLFCGKKFLDAHMRSHKKDEIPMLEEEPPDSAMAESINIQSVTVEFLCLKCGNQFQSRESLEVHICSEKPAKYYFKLS